MVAISAANFYDVLDVTEWQCFGLTQPGIDFCEPPPESSLGLGENSMKKMIALASLATALLASTVARADYEGRIVGNWVTSATEDRFGDGGRYTAVAISENYAFGVRCLDKAFSYAVLPIGDKTREKTLYKFKFRVDRGKVYQGAGLAIGEKIVQVLADPALTADLTTGKELAIRQEVDGVSETHIIKLRSSSKALRDVLAQCPPAKQPVPRFDDDGSINMDSLKAK